MFGYFTEITMPPYAGIYIEIRISISLSIGIIPEIKRHGGRGGCNNEFTFLLFNILSVFIEYLHFHAEPSFLSFSGVDRRYRAAKAPATVNIGAARYGRKLQVLFYIVVNILKTFYRERRTRGEYGFEFIKIKIITRLVSAFFNFIQIFCAGAEDGYLFVLCQFP